MALTPEGKQDLALALILLKDFKSQGKFDSDLLVQIINLAKHLGVFKEYEDLIPKIPPMEIKPREYD